MVLAGAGSGKTRVITHRIARLIERGTRPEAILAVTFTNKAAGEMAHRVGSLTRADAARSIWLSTFHSFGVRFLRAEAKAAGLDGPFVVFDQSDSLGLLRELIGRSRRGQRRLDAAAIGARISLWKNKLVAPEDTSTTDVEYDDVAREVYPLYEGELRSMRAVDFDDLVVLTVKTLQNRPDVRARWQTRFRHLLIDEFQDTNSSQLELAKLLTNELGNICVVGDDDQSIYGWRGADVSNILQFEKHFPGAKIVCLEENYRSRPEILAVANNVIAQSSLRKREKKLRATRASGPRVRLCELDDTESEATLVSKEIKDVVANGAMFGNVGILYRSNLQAQLVEEQLRARQIPYRLFGGTQIFDRKEVKDAAAYLRVVVNPRDELSLRRVLNCPPRGIGATTVERVSTHARAERIPFVEALVAASSLDGVPNNARGSIARLLEDIGAARKQFRSGERLAATASALFERVGLNKDLLSEERGKSGAHRHENVQFLVRALERYEQSVARSDRSLTGFLERITLSNEAEEEQTGNRVTLSTLHAAKGLEFDIVFVIGCVEGQIPHARFTDPKISEAAPADLDEERRLFYVGVTRARERLYLTRPKKRMLRGTVTPMTPSRFLEGLPEDAIEVYSHPGEQTIEVDEMASMSRDILARLTAR